MSYTYQVFNRILACAILLWLAYPAMSAPVAGTVTNTAGTVTSKSADGTLKVVAPKSTVAPGDMLFTGKDSFARIKFADGGEIILRSNSNFKVESYNFDEKQPEKDSAGFNLLKGSLRALSGSIGKRGDPDSYAIKTPTATAGIRGTAFGLLVCKGDCNDITTAVDTSPLALADDANQPDRNTPADTGTPPWLYQVAALGWGSDLPAVADASPLQYQVDSIDWSSTLLAEAGIPPQDGLHIEVEEGSVILKNDAGSQVLNAGQHGYIKDASTPLSVVPPEQAVPIKLPPHIRSEFAKTARQERKSDSDKKDSLVVVPDTKGPERECK